MPDGRNGIALPVQDGPLATSPSIPDGGTGTDLVTTLNVSANLAATLADPEITLVRACGTYLMYKRRRLTDASERGYRAILDDFTAGHPKAKLSEFAPPTGSHLIEDYLTERYGHLEPRTYNKGHSVLSDLFKWHVAKGTIRRDPMLTIERAKTRAILRQTFTDAQVIQILTANRAPRDQIALRLLLFFGIRKGALRHIRFEHFDTEKRQLVVFTKGQTIHTLQIVDDEVWSLLGELNEPGHHYLLPKRVTRKRTPPTRRDLAAVGSALAAARPNSAMCSTPSSSPARGSRSLFGPHRPRSGSTRPNRSANTAHISGGTRVSRRPGSSRPAQRPAGRCTPPVTPPSSASSTRPATSKPRRR
jgi:integrase